jgi:integrase
MVVKSAITTKNYEGFIRRLHGGLCGGEKAVDKAVAFLEDHVAVCAWIDALTLSDNSKKAYYVAIKTKLRDENKFPEAALAYDAKFKALAEKIYLKAKDQTLTPTEAEKYMPWDDILALKDKIEPKADETEWHQIQDWVIYSLYTMTAPIRADYSPMMFLDRKPVKAPTFNYLVLRNKDPYVVLKYYKTSETFGTVERKIPKPLADVLRIWRTMNPSEWLLLKSKGGEPLNPDNLSQRVIRLFERVAGKSLGISMLRHAYITKMRSGKELTLLQKEALAHDMLHSTLTNELYRRVDTDTESV